MIFFGFGIIFLIAGSTIYIETQGNEWFNTTCEVKQRWIKNQTCLDPTGNRTVMCYFPTWNVTTIDHNGMIVNGSISVCYL